MKLLIAFALVMVSVSTHLWAQQTAPPEKTISDLDIEVVHVEELSYPPLAWQARIEGVVVVRAILNNQGNVTSSGAISGHPVLVSMCLPNSLKWRFEPNTDHAVVIVYNFRLDPDMCPSNDIDIPCRSQVSFREPNFVTISIGPPRALSVQE